MATRDEVVVALKVLQTAYPRLTLDKDSVDIYASMLEDMPSGRLAPAIERHIKNNTWPPSIADIRRAGGWDKEFGWGSVGGPKPAYLQDYKPREQTPALLPAELVKRIGEG